MFKKVFLFFIFGLIFCFFGCDTKKEISIGKDTIEITCGESIDLEITKNFDDDVFVESDNDNIKVEGCKVTGVTPGKSTLTIKSEKNDVKLTVDVTVKYIEKSLSIDGLLNELIYLDNYFNEDVSYKVDDNLYVTYDQLNKSLNFSKEGNYKVY